MSSKLFFILPNIWVVTTSLTDWYRAKKLLIIPFKLIFLETNVFESAYVNMFKSLKLVMFGIKLLQFSHYFKVVKRLLWLYFNDRNIC